MAIVRPGTVQKSVLQVNETLTIATDANSSCRWGSLSPVPGSGLGANLDLPAAFVAVPASSSITVGPFAVATSIYIDFIAGPSVNITQVAAAPLPAHAGQPVDVVKLFGSAAPTAATGANIAAPGSEYVDVVGANLYLQAGTKAVPSWKLVTRAP
jgi:hypothetical protein